VSIRPSCPVRCRGDLRRGRHTVGHAFGRFSFVQLVPPSRSTRKGDWGRPVWIDVTRCERWQRGVMAPCRPHTRSPELDQGPPRWSKTQAKTYTGSLTVHWRLWRDMTNTAPNVVFPHHSRVRRLLTVPGQLSLYRRVIEIRDAIIILCNYTTPEVVQAAERHVSQADVPEDHRNAAITACWLATARDRRRQGYPAQAQTLAAVSTGGEILA
jgi:hypothetical protein